MKSYFTEVYSVHTHTISSTLTKTVRAKELEIMIAWCKLHPHTHTQTLMLHMSHAWFIIWTFIVCCHSTCGLFLRKKKHTHTHNLRNERNRLLLYSTIQYARITTIRRNIEKPNELDETKLPGY